MVVPRDLAAATLERARAKVQIEREWFRKVEEGIDTADFLGFAAQARTLGIEIV